MDGIILFKKHNNFDFEEARKLAKNYSLSPDIMSFTELSMNSNIGKKCVSRYIRVAIVFSLIPKKYMEIIIDKRVLAFNKSRSSKGRSIENFEKALQLSNERKELLKKIKFYADMF